MKINTDMNTNTLTRCQTGKQRETKTLAQRDEHETGNYNQ